MSMNVVIQSMRGSAENTFFSYVHEMYMLLFKQLEKELDWKISFNSRPCVKEEFGNPHGQHHTIVKIEGCKPIVIDERETSHINPIFNEYDAWFIIKYAYREHPDFYTSRGMGIDGDEKSKNLGGCKHSVVPWLGHALEFGRWNTKPCNEWVSNFDQDINLIFTGTDRVNRDTLEKRSETCHKIAKYIPKKSYIGLHTITFDGTSREIDSLLYSDVIMKLASQDYQEKLKRSRIGLSLPGLGLACYREYEFFAQCIPVISPAFQIKYIEPLIPDFHYVAFDVHNPPSFKDAYDKLQNKEFYDFISINAWNWWQQNCNPKNIEGIYKTFLKACGKVGSFREKFAYAYK